MPFRFRLEKVLKVRRRLLEQRTRQVADAARAKQRCLDRETVVAEAYRRAAEAAPAAEGSALDVRDLAEQALRLRRLGELHAEAVRATAAATVELEHWRARLTEAWRDVEVLRKLEQRRREQWEEDQRRAENRRLDEVGAIRAERERRSKVST